MRKLTMFENDRFKTLLIDFSMKDVRTWVEIDSHALRSNAEQFLNTIVDCGL